MIVLDVTTNRAGLLSINGVRTAYYVHNTGKHWYLFRPAYSHPQFARHPRKRDVLDAVRVFVEGGERREGESHQQALNRLLQSCLETSSTDIVDLRWPK